MSLDPDPEPVARRQLSQGLSLLLVITIWGYPSDSDIGHFFVMDFDRSIACPLSGVFLDRDASEPHG